MHTSSQTPYLSPTRRLRHTDPGKSRITTLPSMKGERSGTAAKRGGRKRRRALSAEGGSADRRWARRAHARPYRRYFRLAEEGIAALGGGFWVATSPTFPVRRLRPHPSPGRAPNPSLPVWPGTCSWLGPQVILPLSAPPRGRGVGVAGAWGCGSRCSPPLKFRMLSYRLGGQKPAENVIESVR